MKYLSALILTELWSNRHITYKVSKLHWWSGFEAVVSPVHKDWSLCWSHRSFSAKPLLYYVVSYSFDSVFDRAAYYLKCIKMLTDDLVCGCDVSSTIMLEPPQFHFRSVVLCIMLCHIPCVIFFWLCLWLSSILHKMYQNAHWWPGVWLWCLQYIHAAATTVSLPASVILCCVILLTQSLTKQHST